ncbi:NAD(+) diphosphatase [Actinoplanes siamensis]|uniref:NAD(+) diphosphatase n=1 Tax=Actinoplanes siamensis TaxID=1223317 RepID=A0A919TJ28_9ACTN|nr:NAD(+) diphosphatase [Actinoplanes siamensis]GIF04298.1 NADH pyrophosphatase [Actinoplanes siamensis]
MAFDGLFYTETPYDRAPSLRQDPAWVAAQAARPDARVIPLWRDRCLTTSGQPVVASGTLANGLSPAADHQITLLGLTPRTTAPGATPVFAVDLSDYEEADALRVAGADATADLRSLAATLPHAEAATLAYARGLLHWNRATRFCGSCGCPAVSEHAGHVRRCTGRHCGRQLFPRIEPAVIVLVEAPGPEPRCLLARHHGAAPDRFALIAGFVEIGESLEGTVRREVLEEAGVRVGEVSYQASQGWPFPAGLMIGFRARAVDDTIAVDGAELQEARWFTRAEVAARASSGPPDSIGGHLLRAWAGLPRPAAVP